MWKGVLHTNIYDIAKEAGVSISTVSRVLNKKDNVTPATRKKIEDVMRKYDYKPSAVARGLVMKSMRTIGILSVDIRVPHYANTAYILEQEFSHMGYNVILCNTGGSMDKNRKYIQNLVEKQVDGMLFVGSTFNSIQHEPDILELLREIPLVIANGQLSLPSAYSILVDDRMGVDIAVGHLYQKGHRDIVYIKDLDTESADIKKQGYETAMKRRGMGAHMHTVESTYGLDGGAEAINGLIQDKKTFSAIVCGEDLTAVGSMKRLTALGYRIPKDVAVIGYNNSEYARIATPELTTVDNKGHTSSQLAAQLLCNLIEHEGPCASLVVQPELVLRESG